MKVSSHKIKVIDLANTKRDIRFSISGLLLKIEVIFYFLISSYALATERKELVLFALLVVAPILGVTYIFRQVALRVDHNRQVRETKKKLSALVPYIGSDLSWFDIKLSQALREILNQTESPEFITFGGLLGYMRILGIREGTAPILESNVQARQQLQTMFASVVSSLNTRDWTGSFEDIGHLLAYLASISSDSSEEDKTTSHRGTTKEFAQFLRTRAGEIHSLRLWAASFYVFKSLRTFRGSFPSELTPWVALILFWLNARLYHLSDLSLKEVGSIFASEYQLLAHQLLVLADAVELEEWKTVVEVLIASNKANKTTLQFGLRQPSF